MVRVNRAGHAVTSDDMSKCLSQLLDKEEAKRQELRGYLAGKSIDVASRGHLCHLGDKGSIVIPMNCSSSK
jgi:hypothetical protein